MIWIFFAGMFCGATLLILLILVSDRSFLDLLAGRLSDQESSSVNQMNSLEVQKHRRLAVGTDS